MQIRELTGSIEPSHEKSLDRRTGQHCSLCLYKLPDSNRIDWKYALGGKAGVPKLLIPSLHKSQVVLKPYNIIAA